ncbi:colicin E3/pyocin S6 family cytotoxin, partial [Streptomyces sp. NPDC003233]
EQSAKDAAASATTARKAQQDAQNAAAAAVTSAAQAQYSATAARGSADSARTAAQQARASALAAGKDANAAANAAMEAFRTAVQKQQQEIAKWQQLRDKWRKEQSDQQDDGSWVPDWLKDTANTIGDYGQAILGNPDIWKGLFETGAGVIGVGGGASLDVAGGGLCLTIIGCLEGAPAIVVGTGLAGAGIYGITDGISRFNNGLGQALREAESDGGGGSLSSDKYWPNGKASDVCGIEGSNGCEQVAESIQQNIGGSRMRVTDRYGAPTLGKYREQDSFWGHHDVVVKDGRVYDAWTGPEGEPLDEYRGKFEWGDDLVFTPLD